jgi:hypothetical protein
VFRTRGRADAAVIIEVQRQISAHKRRSWPVYVTTLHARLRCPVLLLVIVPNDSVAAWARRRIDLGHPGFALTPIVVAFRDVPEISDPGEAQRSPTLEVLSSVAHPERPHPAAAAAALGALPDHMSKLYFEWLKTLWPAAARHELERLMTPERYAELERMLQEEAAARAIAPMAVGIARAKLGTLSDDDESTLGEVTDRDAAMKLVVELGCASSPAEVRAILDRVAVQVWGSEQDEEDEHDSTDE